MRPYTLVNPMLSYQEKLDITMESQRNLQSAFNAKCVHDGPVGDAAAGGGGVEAPRDLTAGPGR